MEDTAAIILAMFLAANTALALVCAIVRAVRGKNVGIVLFFVFLPGLGFLLFYLPRLFPALFGKAGVDREAVLTHAFDIDRQPEHPDMREALDVVPVEDAMAVSGTMEKRDLLLKQLTKSLEDNYKILLAAEQDEDSESAHYIAAAKMEIYRLQQARWLECRRDSEQYPDDLGRYHAACAALVDMLSSEVLSDREMSAYRRRLCEMVQERIEASEDEVTLEEYVACLESLVELGRYDDAELLWLEHADRMRSEAAYSILLGMFYRMGDRRKFEGVMDDLRRNRQVRLTPAGLEQLRYWTNRLAASAPDGLPQSQACCVGRQ